MDDMNQNQDQEPDIIEMTDDEGNTILMQVVDYFFYNGEEYVILSDTIDEDDELAPEEINCYIMHVLNTEDPTTGEELEEFEPVEDPDLESKLIEIATAQLNEDDEPEV